MDTIGTQLNKFPRYQMTHFLWEQPELKPEVNFTMAYDDDHIFLKFFVNEHFIKAIYRQVNDPVYKDTCVELFIAFGDDKNYYNLEFNCIGTCLGQYGADKYNRGFLPVNALKTIKSKSNIKNPELQNGYQWELTLKIPTKVFIYHYGANIFNDNIRLNLYKCGDDLEQPHYLAWSNIKSAEPNFHLSEFFGTGTFKS